MKAIKCNGPSAKPSMQDVPAPASPSAPVKVILRTAFASATGTDVMIFQGHFPCPPDLIPGHCFSGVITAVGGDVRSCKVGDRVAVNPTGHCGNCKFCKRGKVNHCVTGGLRSMLGMAQDGGFAEYVEVPASQVEVLPPDLTLQQAVLCDSLSCIMHCYQLCNTFRTDSQILIMGAGAAGLLCATFLNHHGYHDVIQAEPILQRRKYAENLNPKYQVLHPDDLKRLREKKDAEIDGFDVVIDCSGNHEAFEQAYPLMARGASYLVFGIAPPGASTDLPLADLVMKELCIQGSIVNTTTFPETVILLEKLFKDKCISLESLGIATFPFKDYETALELLATMEVTRVVFEIGGENPI